jgi:hypothetical protein
MNLTPSDLEMFRGLGIDRALLDKAGIERVTDAEAREFGLTGIGDMSGIILPYRNGNETKYFRVRRDHPGVGEDGKPVAKYMAPASGPDLPRHLYFPPISTKLLGDKNVPVVLVESEKASLALTAWSERTGQPYMTIAMGGCYGWSAGKDEKSGEKILHPDLQICRDRRVYILMDSNSATSENVRRARRELAASLKKITALVHILDLPPVAGVNGPDDYVGQQGDQALTDLFDDQKTGSAVLAEVEAFLRRFMVMSDAQYTAVALWIAHTWAIDACTFTPYLAVSSCEKRCAKSRLLEVLFYLVRRPWNTSGVSGPTLFRGIDAKDRPTLLLDEVDALLKGNPETVEAVRGLLNTGNKVGGTVSRCVGKEFLVKDFNTFCPKAVAGIGGLPDTIKDRSLPIRLQRKLTSNKVERLRARLVKPEADALRSRLSNWVENQIARLKDARPPMPEGLDDRQMEGTEILLALADQCSGDWPGRSRAALLELFGAEDVGEDSARMRLLVDLRDLFGRLPLAEVLPTDQILEELKEIEGSPWSEWNRGKGLTRHALAKILKPFGVFPGQFMEKTARIRGYRKTDLQDAWNRYLPPLPLTPLPQLCNRVETNVYAGPEAILQSSSEPLVHDCKNEVSINKDAGPAQLHDSTRGDKGNAVETASESKPNGTAKLPDPATLPESTQLSETVARLRQRFHYGEPTPAATVIPVPSEVMAAIPPDDPAPAVPVVAPEMAAESEEVRAYFLEQEAVWRSNPYAPPKIPDTSGLIPFLAAQQVEMTPDRQICAGDPPDLRPGRAGDVGQFLDEDAKRRARYRRKN